MNKKNNNALRATSPNNALIGEKVCYHNKYQGQPEDYQTHIATYGENYKYVTPANKQGFHSEFIINDKTNNLVSQWNAYEFDANGHVISDPTKTYTQAQQLELVDGNSVNFAERDGGYHTKADSDSVSKYDSKVRKKIGNGWENPGTDSDEADYFDRNKSEEKANDILRGEMF